MCARVRNIVALVACIVLMSGEIVSAQKTIPGTTSNYAEAAINSIQSQNSAKQYTVNRVNKNVLNRAVTRTGVRGINQQNYLLNNQGSPGGQRGSKPFSMIDRGPVVSPYLQLDNPLSTASDYYNVVKPLQEQRRVNDRVMKQQYMQARKLNQIAAQGPYEVTGNENAAPTGHSTGFMKFGTYMNLGGYFAPQTQPKQQQR